MSADHNRAHTALCSDIQLAIGNEPFVKLFKNTAGVLPYGDRYIKFGLANGVSDLLGYRSVAIDKSWLGKRVAVFVGIEVKTGSGRTTSEQAQFLDVVSKHGGFCGVARSVDEAWKIVLPDHFRRR